MGFITFLVTAKIDRTAATLGLDNFDGERMFFGVFYINMVDLL